MADLETPSNAQLSMDRGIPLGNSLDVDGRRALHVKVKNKTDGSEPLPLPNNAAQEAGGHLAAIDSGVAAGNTLLGTIISGIATLIAMVASAANQVLQIAALNSIDSKSTRAHGTAALPFTTIALSTASATLLAANANRKSAIIFNTSGKAMYLKLGAAAVANKGIRLADNEGYYVGSDNLWTGTVTGIVSAGAGSAEVFEGVV